MEVVSWWCMCVFLRYADLTKNSQFIATAAAALLTLNNGLCTHEPGFGRKRKVLYWLEIFDRFWKPKIDSWKVKQNSAHQRGCVHPSLAFKLIGTLLSTEHFVQRTNIFPHNFRFFSKNFKLFKSAHCDGTAFLFWLPWQRSVKSKGQSPIIAAEVKKLQYRPV